MIVFQQVSFSYDTHHWVLDQVDLTIPPGSMLTILGQNGSGKTTLAKHLNGLLKPHRGDVWIHGVNTKQATVATLSKSVAYVFQNPNHQIFANSVYQEIAFSLLQQGLSPIDVEQRVLPVLDQLGLRALKDTHPMFINQAQKQLVAVASYLVLNPEVFVFDEPTSSLDALDAASMYQVFDTLLEQGKTIIVITHDMNFVMRYPTRVVVMHDAKLLFDGSASGLFASPVIFQTTGLELPQLPALAQQLAPLIPNEILTIDQWIHHLETKGR